MHHGQGLTASVLSGLGWYYVLVFVLNAGAAYYVCQARKRLDLGVVWGVLSGGYLVLAISYFVGSAWGDPASFPLRLPDAMKNTVDYVAGPVTYSMGSVALFALFFWFRRFFTHPAVAWAALNLLLLFLGLSMTDWDFRQIVGKPDNVPIVAMIFLLGFFTWLGISKAVDNDRRIAEGRPLAEEEESEKVLVWPDLVYTELIAMVVVTVVLVAWGIAFKAPLEQPASTLKTPNPSKAPWYFLGLQEMLVYFDPWMAGVVLPSMIIVGLMAIPYIDFNKQGNGYYTFAQRKFAILMFVFGFLVMWVTLILLGTFLRGPNWNFFGPYEPWDVHKLVALNNVNLSEYLWIGILRTGLPSHWLVRELPGILLVLAYLLLVPPLLAVTVFRSFVHKMGFIRYMVLANLILFMASLPIKMVLRWTLNLKYIVAIEEFFFNI